MWHHYRGDALQEAKLDRQKATEGRQAEGSSRGQAKGNKGGHAKGNMRGQEGSHLKGLDDMGAHEGLLGLPSPLKGVVLPPLPLLGLCLLEAGHQPLHPLMHPQICPLPPLPATTPPPQQRRASSMETLTCM